MLEDVQREHEKEIKKLKKVIAELMELVASLRNRNTELDEKRKKALSDYYETAVKLEEAQGLILKLAQDVADSAFIDQGVAFHHSPGFSGSNVRMVSKGDLGVGDDR